MLLPKSKAVWLSLLFSTIAVSQQAYADGILVSAPSANGSYYGMYCNTCDAASFTLTSAYDVSTIDVVLRTPSTSNFATFNFSLQDGLTGNFNTFASASLTAAVGTVSTEAIDIDQILQAGTYYLVGNVPGYFGSSVTAGDVDGWLLSTGVYDDTAGAVTNGSWVNGLSGWQLVGNVAPAFTVNGSAAGSNTPEPSTLGLLGLGLVLTLTRLQKSKIVQ
jgi:hypothetical protein